VRHCIPSRIIEKFFRRVTPQRPCLRRCNDNRIAAALSRETPGNKEDGFVAAVLIFRKNGTAHVTSCECFCLRKKLQQPKKIREFGLAGTPNASLIA
jgi:hypothetical protein